MCHSWGLFTFYWFTGGYDAIFAIVMGDPTVTFRCLSHSFIEIRVSRDAGVGFHSPIEQWTSRIENAHEIYTLIVLARTHRVRNVVEAWRGLNVAHIPVTQSDVGVQISEGGGRVGPLTPSAAVAAGAPSASASSFVPSATFTGSRAGYVFKKGAAGQGYYTDVAPLITYVSPPQPAASDGSWGASLCSLLCVFVPMVLVYVYLTRARTLVNGASKNEL